MVLSKKDKWISNAIAIIIMLFFFVLIVPFPVNRTYDAIEIKLDDPNYLVKRQVKISGTYHINILESCDFKGQIEVSGYPLTAEKMGDLYSMPTGAPITYSYDKGVDSQGYPNRQYYFFGRLYSKLFLSKPLILVYVQTSPSTASWGAREGYALVPNVDNFYDAIDVLKDRLYDLGMFYGDEHPHFTRP